MQTKVINYVINDGNSIINEPPKKPLFKHPCCNFGYGHKVVMTILSTNLLRNFDCETGKIENH